MQLSATKKKLEKQVEELTHDIEEAESSINRLEKDKQVNRQSYIASIAIHFVLLSHWFVL